MLRTALIATLAVFLAAAAGAQVAVGIKAGTLGLGAEVAFSLGPHLDGRLLASKYDYGLDYTASDIDYEGELELASVAALIDFRPGGGALRLTVGAVYNDNTLVGRSSLNELLEEELGQPLPVDLDLGTLVGEAQGNEFGPYVGIGFGNPLGSGSPWRFSFDVGVIYHGDVEVDLDIETTFPFDEVPGAQELVDEALAEEERELEAEADDYKFYPVISFGLAYRF